MKVIFNLLLAILLSTGFVTAQNKQVTGTVTFAKSGEPIIGATVFVKGTTVGVATDLNGKFQLRVANTVKTLSFSYIGMESLDLPIKSVMNVSMQTSSEQLDEVIVVAYGTSKKASFTGSAGVMKSEQLEKRQVSNISNALSGAIAGVQVQSTNGQPGTSAKIKIRGVGSINAESDPLYVVDGIPYDGEISSINSSDIESMTVLKDAASTSLYGSRGANGVIMITTKRGRTDKAVVNFDAKFGINSRQIENYDVMTSSSMYLETLYRSGYNAGLGLDGYDAAKAHTYANSLLPKNTSNGGTGYTIYTLAEGESLIGTDGKLNPNATLGYSDGDYFYTPDNWSDEMFSANSRTEYNMNISGATDRSNYYMSFGYLDDSGIIDGSGFERYTARLRGDHQAKEWLKVGANLAYTYSDSRNPGSQDEDNTASSANAFYIANFIAPIYPLYVRNADGTIKQNQGRKVYDYGDGKSTNFSRPFMSIANPAGDLIYNKDEYLRDILNASWYADLTPVEGLTLTARYGLNVDNARFNSLGNAYSGQSESYGGTAWQDHKRKWGFDQQYIANYQKSFNIDHHIDVMVGYDGYSYTYNYVAASGQNLYNPDLFYVSNSIDQRIGYGRADNYATEGYLGRLNYNFKDTYFASVSFRRDASSRFHPDNRWGNFWSASGAWIISNESFMSDSDKVNMLKLKASFGEQGNDLIGNYYGYMDQYKVTGSDGIFSDGTLTYKGNPDLTWETSTAFNVGVDFALFDNKFSGSVEYFVRQSNDMLYYKPVGPTAGYSEIPMNVGSMRNSGLEVNLNYTIINKNSFTWDVNLNATSIKNEIIELHPDLEGELIDGSRIYSEGESMYRMNLVKFAGVDKATGEALYWSEDEEGKSITTTNYADAQQYKQASDDLLPSVYGGFSTSIGLKGFDISAQFAYQLGGQIYDSGYRQFMHNGYGGGGRNWHMDIQNAWSETNTTSDIPRLNAADKYANSTSDRFLVSSDYLALNNVTVGYTIPKSITTKFSVEKLRIYFVADNVALLTARKGLDPRQSYTSSTTALYTPIRTVSGGISLTF